ncbi:MAG: cytochrome b N-terminal domain-containing protein [Acidobacteria bacterium]|nr:cytochrome b N-terminal domain-containing protein [Acidobacteriota bacterium]
MSAGTLRELTNEPVPWHLKRWWFALGGTPAYLFVVQIPTGILLAFYYAASAGRAYESVRFITEEAAYGWYLRSVHKWAATLMIAAVVLHQMRVFFTGAYRKPRELNWIVHAVVHAAARVHRLQPRLRAVELLGGHGRRQHHGYRAGGRRLAEEPAAGGRDLQRPHARPVDRDRPQSRGSRVARRDRGAAGDRRTCRPGGAPPGGGRRRRSARRHLVATGSTLGSPRAPRANPRGFAPR